MIFHHCPTCGAPVSPGAVKVETISDKDRSVTVDGKRRRIGPVMWEILTLLRRNPDQWVPAERIYDRLYSDRADPPFDNIVRVHMHNLRKKLAGTEYHIASLKGAGGLGYRLELV